MKRLLICLLTGTLLLAMAAGSRGAEDPSGLDPSPLTEALKKHGCSAVLYGECRERLAQAMPEGLAYRFADGMEDATRQAIELAGDVGTVILSPAATSFDRYKSFEERGEHFKKIVMNLP